MRDGCFTVIFFTILIAICTGLNCAVESTRCSEVGKVLSYKTEWKYFTGCVVEKPDGSKVLLRQMRDMER